MGYSQADKAETHDRIVKLAAARFREKGIDSIGVADLMKEAGLTHGGFYRHFDSREALVVEAIERALQDGAKRAVDASNCGRLTLDALVDFYLSVTHRDAVAQSCAVTTMAGDVARSNERVRQAYTRQVETYLEILIKLVMSEKKRSKRAKAIAALSTLVGAVSMARAVNDEALSREILKSAGDELKAQLK